MSIERALENIEHSQRKIIEQLEHIERLLHVHRTKTIHGFAVKQESPMLPIAPGFSPVFTATPQPEGTVIAAGLVPTWVSSDTSNAPISVDPTGLVATVAIPTTAVVGAAFTLTVSMTNTDQTVATGTISLTIIAAPSTDVTSFTIAQTK